MSNSAYFRAFLLNLPLHVDFLKAVWYNIYGYCYDRKTKYSHRVSAVSDRCGG